MQTRNQFYDLTVVDLHREGDEAVSVAFGVPAELVELLRFDAGQYLTLRATIDGEDLRRSYSLCAAPHEAELRVAIKRVEGGVFSTFANRDLRVGDTLSVMPPQGRFVLPPVSGPRTLLGIAAGSGITPVIAILKDVLKREPDSRFVLFYGNRTTRSILFRDTLETLKDQHMTRLAVHHVLSREASDVPLLHGRLDGERIAALLRTLRPEVLDTALLCGPGDFIANARASLLARGLAQARVLAEQVTPEGEAARPARAPVRATTDASPPSATASIRIDGRTHAITLNPDETIIEAAARAGLELPFSCKGGMCCTCRARLTAGKVEMRQNYSLEEWEMKAGFVLTCQSVPVTREVAVDFDQL